MRRTVTESDADNDTLYDAARQVRDVIQIEDDNDNEDLAAIDDLVSPDFQSGGQESFEENEITVERNKKKFIRQAKKRQKASDLKAVKKQRAKDLRASVRSAKVLALQNKKNAVASAQSRPKSRPEVKSSADAAAFETEQVGAAKSKSRSKNKKSRPKSDSHPEVQPPVDAVFNGMDSSTDEAEMQDDLHQKTAAALCTAKSIFGFSTTDEDETPGDVDKKTAAKSRSKSRPEVKSPADAAAIETEEVGAAKSRPKSDSHPEVQPPADACMNIVKVDSSIQALQSSEQKKKSLSKKSAHLQKQNMAIYDRTVDTMCEWLDDVYRKDTGSERGLGVFAARRIASERPCAK